MNNFDQKCYNFKNNIINVFNECEDIPFLLKYYLIKQIWEQINNHKQEIEIEYIQKNIPQQITKPMSIQVEIPKKDLKLTDIIQEEEQQS